ncbi:hypothetical protein [Kitasatospora sp. NPDC101183]|uniref:TolB family protein n=1 Tax=Kitasatospora sp. NPDC101183 TaxID=3364100 RepID=UPI003814336C
MRTRTFIVPAAVAVLLLTGCSSGSDDKGAATPAPASPKATGAAPGATASGGSAAGAQRRGDGAELVYRADGTRSAQNPAYAPDGGSLLLTEFAEGYNKGAAALRTLPLAGGAAPATVLSDQDKTAVNLSGTSWSASAGAFTFASDREDGHDEVWLMKPGGAPERVTRHDDDSGYDEPTFSPDGQWIVYQQSWDAGNAADQGDATASPAPSETPQLDSLWKVPRGGGAPVKLVDGQATGTANRQPNWSPKGDRIVFQRRAANGENWALWTVNADGSGLRQITEVPGDHTDPSWSPDGRRLVFSSTAGGLANAQVFVVSADGGTPARVTNDGASYDGAPSWSPDGKWIAFESSAGGADDHPAALWRIAAPAQ